MGGLYGLGSVSRLTGDPGLSEAAREVFVDDIEPLWDAAAGVSAPAVGEQRHVYTPQGTAAAVAGLNTMACRPTRGGSETSVPADGQPTREHGFSCFGLRFQRLDASRS